MPSRYFAKFAGLSLALSLPGMALAATAHFTTSDTPINTLIADPAAKAVLDKDIPGMSDNPSIGVVGTMTLRGIQSMSPDKLTDKTLDQVDADLAKIPPK